MSEASRILDRIFSYTEMENIRLTASDLFRSYCHKYNGKPLSKSWAKRKGMDENSFWKGLGYKSGNGKFFQLFDIVALPKKYNGDEVYQVDYFDIKVADDKKFMYACDQPKRRLLPSGDLSFDDVTGKPTKYFCAFITDFMIESALKLGY